MSDIAHHFVRRAVAATQQHIAQSAVVTSNNGQPDEQPQIKQLAAWGIVLLWATAILYMAAISAVSAPLSLPSISFVI